MKKIVTFVIILALAVSCALLGGCSGSQNEQTQPAGTEAAETTEKVTEAAEATTLEETTEAITETAAAETTAPAAEETTQAASNSGNTDSRFAVSVNDAKQIALQDAGMSEGEVTFAKEVLDDDDTPEYEIVFYKENQEFSYDIDPDTGAIKSRETDQEDFNVQAAIEAISVSKEEALDVALGYAEAQPSDVSNIKVYLEPNDGRIEYEVQYTVDTITLEFKVDPITAKLISAIPVDTDDGYQDSDFDDDDDGDDD